LCLVLVTFVALAIVRPAAAQELLPDAPVLLTADKLDFDEDLGIATARGNVEIVQGERVLNADAVTYNQRDNIVIASGNVVLLEPTGEVLFAEFAELSDDMREGFLRGFRMRLIDDARLAAVSAQRRGGVKTELTRAAYTPCVDCEGLNGEPLWQIKARRIIHDVDARNIVYRHATLEFLGLPVMYTPYLSHPDPSTKRKSGFLVPTFGASTLLGNSIQVPYFWAIDTDKDLRLDPIISTDNLPVLTGKYRQRFSDGEHYTRVSGTQDNAVNSQERFRGHVDSETRFSINKLWRWGLDVKLASDDTYQQRYGFKSSNTLTSHSFVEGFGSRSYAAGEAYYFQGLSEDDEQDKIPIVVPKFNYNFVGDPNSFGGMTTIDANLQALSREQGATSQRASMTPGWQISNTDSLGTITSFRTSLQSDLYNTYDVATNSGTNSGVYSRLFPQATATWRYPWVRRIGSASQILEPIAALVIAPNGGNPSSIPNEDSQSVEFDETNLFSANRFSGTDRVEGGQRVVYGLRTGLFGASGGSTTLIVGQSYRFRNSSPFSNRSGLEDQLSDIVASVQISPSKFFDLLYKTRVDKDSLSSRRTEITANAGPRAFKLNLNYVFFDQTFEFADREEVVIGLSSDITDQWSARVDTSRDLTSDGSTLSYGASLFYKCDCMDFELNYNRNFTRDRDIPPTESLTFRLIFKSLGQVSSAVL
ncbi:MAG: LPS assembly protein LptD, partial [Alphaproteobacteria bacterium]|nr:LPS assembly protein LptD [Alphaproteobacteria bacterium]